MTTQIQVPYQVPIFAPNGSMNPAWLSWFNAVSTGMISGSGGDGTVNADQVIGIIEEVLPEGSLDFSVPPRLTGFKVTGGFNMIFIEWDSHTYHNAAYVEIYRSVSEIFSYAIPVGTTMHPITVFGDTPPDTRMSQTWYYWGRIVSKAGVPGPFNAVLGTPGSTADDPRYMIELLENELTEDQLAMELNARINLIDTPLTGLVDKMISTNDDLTQEISDRIDAISSEQLARTTAINEEQEARNSLAVQLRGEYTGTDVSSVSTGLIYSETQARITQDSALAQQISLLTAGVAGGFDPYKTWYFDSSVEGWVASGATITWSIGSEGVAGAISVDSTSTNPQIYLSSDLSPMIIGGKYPILRLRLKRTSGTDTSWVGRVYYKTATHGFDMTYSVAIANPLISVGEITSLEWDMSILPDWLGGEILNLRFDLGASTDDTFEIDWIASGRNAPGASVASLYEEATTRATADSAEVTARQLLSSKVLGNVDPTGLTLGTLSSGLIYDERSARSSADSSEVTARQSLSATLTGYTDPTGKTLANISSGIIAEEKTARVSADSANASSISTLSAQVNNTTTGLTAAHSAITAINTVTAGSTSANAAALFSVSSKVNNPSSGLDSKASVTELITTNSTLNATHATALFQTSTTLGGKTATIQTMASSVNGLEGQYTVKIDADNNVAGFGLAIEPSVAGPSTSKFMILADKFTIAASATSPTAADGAPFFHLSVPSLVDGVTLPAGTYLKTAYIGDATITNAKIGSLSADKITAGTITAAISMTSPTINGGIVTGAILRTNSDVGTVGTDHGGIKLQGKTLYVYDDHGTVRVKLGLL